MEQQLGIWLRRLRILATIAFVLALCGSVAFLVIAFIPGSPVMLELPTPLLSGLGAIQGVVPGVVVDPDGYIAFSVNDPSLGQRLLNLATILPGQVLSAEIARRLARLLRAAEASDPFTTGTVRELTFIAKLTAFGGLGVWGLASAGMSVLSTTMVDSGSSLELVASRETPFWWLAIGFIFAAVAQLLARGVATRAELDTVI